MSISRPRQAARHRWPVLIVAFIATLLPSHRGHAGPAELKLARLSPADEAPAELGPLPRPLAFADIVRYRQIFALERAADWGGAERLIAELDDALLLGHVLAARYTHPTAYHPTYRELAEWLDRYADLPQAAAIYRMALERRPPGADKPTPPASIPGKVTARETRERANAGELWRQGIAAWRSGDVNAAADQFTRLANDERLDGETLARAAFWAARADLRARRPEQVTRLLRRAARSSDEFYGLLAQKTLDERIDFDWHEEQLKESMLDLLIRYPAAQRAIALGQVGEDELAEGEVRRMAERARPELAQALIALAASLELPSIEMDLAPQAGRVDGRRHDDARYPLPRWEPTGGYRLDPSLVNAVIRAESGFNERARSPKGALGLMQVMPDTARHVAKLTQLAYNGEGWLLHPPNNMAVGQAWLQQLAATKTVDGSLIHLVTAYNAGEGRLIGWQANELKDVGDDPLLFVESVPIAETRGYVKKVLANLWAYQSRLGEPSPSLLALAENHWPDVPPATADKGKAVASAH